MEQSSGKFQGYYITDITSNKRFKRLKRETYEEAIKILNTVDSGSIWLIGRSWKLMLRKTTNIK